MDRIKHLRNQYSLAFLDEAHLDADPFVQFELWMNAALDAEIPEANAMTLATANENGRPSARIVLLRGIHKQGFVFYTNYCSRKGREIEQNPHAALVFFWQPLQRQIRIEGMIEKVGDGISDQYFSGRPRGSQIGAWASDQSSGITGREALTKRLEELEHQFRDVSEIPRPDFWGGYTLIPHAFEYWQGRENRLHDRFRYSKHADTWKIQRLAP